MTASHTKRSLSALENLLRQCYVSPASGCLIRRHYSSSAKDKASSDEVKDVAILGGGITGLASAFYLSKHRPDVRITLFEGSSRLGGWLHSKQVDVGNGNVIFEQGPRTLRPNVPNGLVTLRLVKDLGLQDRLLFTSKNSVAAQNRYVYYPDHLVRMPGPGITLLENLSNLWSEPAFAGLVQGVINDVSADKRPDDLMDESIGAFFSRRFSSKVVDNLISAVLHGIYAGDVYNLSMRALMPWIWGLESEHRSVCGGMWLSRQSTSFSSADWEMLGAVHVDPERDPVNTEHLQAVENSSVFTFKHGLGELSDRLEAHLNENPMVDFRRKTLATDLRLDGEGPNQKMQITTKSSSGGSDSETHNGHFTHVISTISGKTLSNIARNRSGKQVVSAFRDTPSVTVMVVNLFFSDPNVLPVHGFGYLIPRSVPYTQNPERALGVVFDSDATIGQDSNPGTKVTVMLGGHWWDQWESFPAEDEGAKMAKDILRRHLKITAEPDAIRVSLQKDCIPQYTVGHNERLITGSSELLNNFNSRLKIAGNSYTGVGLNDCVRAGREVAKGLAEGMHTAGLEWFSDKQAKVIVKKSDLPHKPWRHSNTSGG